MRRKTVPAVILFLVAVTGLCAKELRGRREYFFDLASQRSQISMTRNGGVFSCTITLPTQKNGYPQEGDILTVYWDGYLEHATEHGIKAQVLFKSDIITSEIVDLTVTTPESFQGALSFITPQDIVNPLTIDFFYDARENRTNRIFFIPVYDGPDYIEDESERTAAPEAIATDKFYEARVLVQTNSGLEVATDLKQERMDSVLLGVLAKKDDFEEEDYKDEPEFDEEDYVYHEEPEFEEEDYAYSDGPADESYSVPSIAISRYQRENLLDFMVEEESLLPSEESGTDRIETPDATDTFGQTLLMKAARAGNDWQIRRLLASGANVNLKDKDGWTALMYAARYQENISTINLLLDARAEVKERNRFNATALSMAAAYNNNPEILERLLTYYNVSEKEVMRSFVLLVSSTSISEFAQTAKFNVFTKRAVPVNAFYEGKTPLMYAAQYGNSTGVLRLLLDNNASTTIRSSEGKTAFDYAARNSNLRHDDNYWLLNQK